MKRSCGNRRKAILAGTVALIGLTAAASANDRGVRGTMIPASSCQLVSQSDTATLVGNAWVNGIFRSRLACPLPLNNIDLGGTSADNDITKFRAHYKGSANDFAGRVLVQLIVSGVSNGSFTSSVVCGGNLTPTTINPTETTVACVHDVASDGSFYYFVVTMDNLSGGPQAQFYGIDFPP